MFATIRNKLQKCFHKHSLFINENHNRPPTQFIWANIIQSSSIHGVTHVCDDRSLNDSAMKYETINAYKATTKTRFGSNHCLYPNETRTQQTSRVSMPQCTYTINVYLYRKTHKTFQPYDGPTSLPSSVASNNPLFN